MVHGGAGWGLPVSRCWSLCPATPPPTYPSPPSCRAIPHHTTPHLLQPSNDSPPSPRPTPPHPPAPTAQVKDLLLRYNLLKVPALRSFLRSPLWPTDINFK